MAAARLAPSALYLGVAASTAAYNACRLESDEGGWTPSTVGLAVLMIAWGFARLVAGTEQSTAVAYTGLFCMLLQSAKGQLVTWGQVSWSMSFLMAILQLGGLMLGHELLHQRISRFWPCLVLLQNGYLVYVWEHNFHHKHAGTDLDLASTRRHTSIYSYLNQRFPTHIRSSLRHFPSACLATSLVFIVYVVLMAALFSRATASFLVAMTVLHWFLVDSFTYTSHYATVSLESKDIAWDSEMWSFLVPFFYGIEHHTDHHFRPSHLAGQLGHRGNLKYPVTLEVAFLSAFIPPLWYRLTDPILDRAITQSRKEERK